MFWTRSGLPASLTASMAASLPGSTACKPARTPGLQTELIQTNHPRTPTDTGVADVVGAAGRPAGRPAGRLAGRLAGGLAGRPAGKPAGRPVSRLAGKLAGRPVGRQAWFSGYYKLVFWSCSAQVVF